MKLDASDISVHGNWTEEVCGPRTSLTWREWSAVHLLLQSACQFLTGRFVGHQKDNQNVEPILAHGSRVERLQTEAIGIYEFCMRHFFRSEVE